MKKHKIRATPKTTFASCGLDRRNNMLQAPICQCGCGNYMNLVLKTKQDLYDFMGIMLEDYECHHCAIFTLLKDGNAAMAIKLEDGIKIYVAEKNGISAKKVIAEINENFQFHHYGLLEQVDEESYRIVME